MAPLDTKSIAAHVFVTLLHAQSDRRTIGLEELASEVGVRKEDVRSIVSRLDAEGHVDGVRLRLTMSGLALASALVRSTLREPRQSEIRLRCVA